MIETHDLPLSYRPNYMTPFDFFGAQVIVEIQYIGPVPNVNVKNQQMEIFHYAIYHQGQRIRTGSLKWDPKSGPLTMQEAAKAVVLHWNTNRST